MCCGRLEPGARGSEIGLIWNMRLRVLLSISEGLVRCDGVKEQPWIYQ